MNFKIYFHSYPFVILSFFSLIFSILPQYELRLLIFNFWNTERQAPFPDCAKLFTLYYSTGRRGQTEKENNSIFENLNLAGTIISEGMWCLHWSCSYDIDK